MKITQKKNNIFLYTKTEIANDHIFIFDKLFVMDYYFQKHQLKAILNII